MKARVLSLAVQSAFFITFALPQIAFAGDEESEVYGLTHPNNSVDFGSLYVSQSSARFGQYNGLNKEGFYGLGALDLRGGPGYDGGGSALRWWLGGSDLGTTSRTITGKVSEQGKWSVSVGYDELRHNISNTFQTPLQGNPGGNDFTLPANFGSINAASASGATPAKPGSRDLSPTQLNALQTEQEYTTRQNIPVSATYIFSPALSAQIDFKHTEQSGAKLIGTGSQGGIPLPTGSSPSKGEAINIIMNPTSYTTDNINAALNWMGDKAHLSGGYYGSLFHDNYNSVSWQNAITSVACAGSNCYQNNTMSTAPSNTLHQINLNGGYDFAQTTKLAGGFSWGYNSQNDSFAPTSIMQPNGTVPSMMQANGLPGSSLNGVVETTHADLKLTDQSIKNLTLTAGFKFNERDNNTKSSIYKWTALDASSWYGTNMPFSNRKTQYEAAAAYRLTNNQTLRLGYERESIDRWCNSVVTGVGCVATPSTNEDKINLSYRLKALDNVNFNASYNYGNRTASFDPSFMFDSYQTSGGGTNPINAGNVQGFSAYPYASRNQNMGKAGVTWQVTQQLDMGVNGSYNYENYDEMLGVQNKRAASVNFDTTYNYAENNSLTAYFNWQNGFRNMRSGNNGSASTAPTNIWTNQLDDTSNAFGLMSRHTGLMGGKLEIIGDVSYALDTSTYATQIYYQPTSTCGASTSLTCGTLPPIKNELLSLKLTGNYKVHKNGKISLSYMFQQLNSNDYFYNAQQVGYTPSTMMPTGLQPQSYAVSVAGLTYQLTF